MTTDRLLKEALERIMRDNPRHSNAEYAQMAIEDGVADSLDSSSLRASYLKTLVRQVAAKSKDDPQLCFVSITEQTDDGKSKEVYLPAVDCFQEEAQQVLDNSGSMITGLRRHRIALYNLWTAAPFAYQLKLPFDEGPEAISA